MGVRIKHADRVQLLVHEVETEGGGGAHREDVDQATTNGKFARGDDLAHVLVTGGDKACAQIVAIDDVAHVKEEDARFEVSGRGNALSSRRGRHQKHVQVLAVHQAIQDLQPIAHQILVGT